MGKNEDKPILRILDSKGINFKEGGIFLALLVLCVTLSIATPVFLTSYNIGILGRQITFVALIALGQTLVLLTGGIDLSVGAVAGLCGILGAKLMTITNIDPYICTLIAMGIGICIGLINGFFIAKVGLNSFIVTLGIGEVCAGINLVITRGYPISNIPNSFQYLGRGMVGPFPVPVIILFIITVVLIFVLRNTPYGRNIYAIGGNEQASRLVGIRVVAIKISVYAIAGMLSALAGMMYVSRMNSGQPTVGPSWLMPSITAAIIGGTSLSGGEGTIFGTILGAIFMGVLSNGIILLDISPYWEQVIIGSVVVIAVLIDYLRKRNRL